MKAYGLHDRAQIVPLLKNSKKMKNMNIVNNVVTVLSVTHLTMNVLIVVNVV